MQQTCLSAGAVNPLPSVPHAQVHFIVNNLSTANLEAKGNALKELLPREFWPWFSNYMVVKRAAQVRLQ